MNYLFARETVVEGQTIFRQWTEALEPDSRLQLFRIFDAFAERLRTFNNPEIIVMIGVDKIDIENLIGLSDLIRDAALIVLLSIDETSTVELARLLRPKFIGTVKDDMEKVMPVIQKLIQNNKNRDRLIAADKKQ